MRFALNAIRCFSVVVVVLSLVSITAAPTEAQEPLRWKFEVGEKLDYNMVQDMTLSMAGGPVGEMSTTMKQQMDMTWDVEGVNEEGEAVIRQKINRVRMTSTSPLGNVEYDSESEEPPTGMAAMVAPMFDAMTEGDFEITMTARGEVKDVKIPEEVLDSLKNSPAAQQMGEMATAEGFKKMLTQGAFVLPEKTPAKGESWTTNVELENPTAGKQTVTTTYTYEDTKDVDGTSYAVFKPELKMDFAGNANIKMAIKDQKSDGEVLFDIEKGRLSKSTLNQNVTMEVSVAGQTMEQKIDQKIGITVKPASEETEATSSESSAETQEQEAVK